MKTRLMLLLGALVIFGTSTAHADFFVDRCGGDRVKALSLNGACKKRLGKTIVKCKRKCVKRKCVKRKFLEVQEARLEARQIEDLRDHSREQTEPLQDPAL